MTFENLLKQTFKLNEFRQGQREIISSVLNKKDVLAVLPTGGGKSLCYQFSAIYLQKLVIVISPLIALMKDQVASMQRLGIPSGALHSGQSDIEKKSIFQQMNLGGPFILYLSPERAQKEGFHKWIKTQDVGLFAIDEAHCVSQWGHDFREEYAQLSSLKELRPDVPILALTASATPTVLRDISSHLKLNKPDKMVYGFYRPNLYYQVETCADEEMKISLLLQALNQNPTGRVLVYCGTRKITEEIASFLQKKIPGTGYYHAGLSTEERNSTQQDYIQGKLRVLVATNAFGMGIDQPDVRLVVHYQMPANIDSLYQEMGRAGRDGLNSTCLMLYARKDKGLQSYFIQSSDAPSRIKDSRWKTLESLVNYSEGSECRHTEILTYYKDSQRIENCGHCDVCDPQSDRRVIKPVIPVKQSQTVLKKKKSAQTEIKLNTVEEQRFLTLKKWRKQKAKELDSPAFVIFSDQTLRQLAIKNPQNINQLTTIYGIGEAKLEKFGWDVLAELKNS